jgi:spore coat protein CotH
MKSWFFILGLIISLNQQVKAQSDFYDISEIRNIRLYFQQPNWDYLLDSLYVQGQEARILASVVIDGTRFDSVGVRYKGFSSVSTERKKNPFNIKLDYIKNQSYQGYEKIKLSNVIQDPSFVREALSYEIARKYMPASKANFANVYINDTLWGLYTNVEAVNKQFLSDRFSSSTNPFFKGNPKNLDLNGENSNLSNTHGSDSIQYFDFYDMKSDAGWIDLLELIDVLNDTSKDINDVLNVDQTLWMHAFNYTLINFDSYIGYAQNYYLYKTNNGLFNPILWDLNQSFGSFRLTDGSSFFQGFSVNEAKTMDPLAHVNGFSVQPRPLLRNLLQNHKYRKMYLAHIRTILKENIANRDYYLRALDMQDLIRQDVKDDPNKFYSNTDFITNIDTTVKDLVEYPGIKDLMEGRSAYLSQYPGMVGYPIMINQQVEARNDSVDVTIYADKVDIVYCYYRTNDMETFTNTIMLDDGVNADVLQNDQTFSIRLALSDIEQYYFYAENDSAGAFLPERAAHEYFNLSPTKHVVINEICASNSNTLSDENGDFDDWLELYNNSDEEASLQAYYLTDDAAEPRKWKLPNISIGPQSFVVVWLDNEIEEGELHANFKLSASGENIYLFNESGDALDAISFGEQKENITYGRIPNGIGEFALNNPTPSATNQALDNGNSETEDFVLYPNPASVVLRLLFDRKTNGVITIHHINSSKTVKDDYVSDAWHWNMDVSKLVKGFYILTLTTNTSITTKKFILK